MKRRETLQLATLGAAAALLPTVFAHEGEDHSKKTGPVKKDKSKYHKYLTHCTMSKNATRVSKLV